MNVIDNEMILFDRLEVIKATINEVGENKVYIAFSGGKDSTVLHHLVDLALPNNNIPRVYFNTGIEYQAIVEFVKELANNDERFEMIAPHVKIKQMLEEKGYPFKSKEHSLKVGQYQKGSRTPSVIAYKEGTNGVHSRYNCPKSLLYQFDNSFNIKLSDRCCYELKKKPSHLYERERERTVCITAMQSSEGGQRANIGCISKRGGKMVRFHPLLKVDENWENWFIQKYNIKLCKLYYEPYNFKRTGCKGCPYSLDLQEQLETMEKYLPNERKQCEYIWQPIYDEYRRIGYRLDNEEQLKLF